MFNDGAYYYYCMQKKMVGKKTDDVDENKNPQEKKEVFCQQKSRRYIAKQAGLCWFAQPLLTIATSNNGGSCQLLMRIDYFIEDEWGPQ